MLNTSERGSVKCSNTEGQKATFLRADRHRSATDYDIITGYNIDNFDLPRLADRTGVLQADGLGRDGIAVRLGASDLKPNSSEIGARWCPSAEQPRLEPVGTW